jgi:hypothetical protein
VEPLLIDLVSLSDWYRFVPETLGFLVLILVAQTLLPGISAAGLPHPFWIPVLLMSGQYGIMGGLFATLAATAALFFKGLPAQSATPMPGSSRHSPVRGSGSRSCSAAFARCTSGTIAICKAA